MSRIGRSPITVPSGVNIDVKDGTATVKGPKGTVTAPVPHNFEVEINDGVMLITRPSDNKEDRARHGLTRALMNNAVVGVSEGFTKVLELRGVGYRAEVAGQTLKLALGYSHPVDLALPKEIHGGGHALDADAGKRPVGRDHHAAIVGQTSPGRFRGGRQRSPPRRAV